MTKKDIMYFIRKAFEEGAPRKGAMPETNILNAEYASGKVHAYLDIVIREFGYDEYLDIVERIRPQLDSLLDRAQLIYQRRDAQ